MVKWFAQGHNSHKFYVWDSNLCLSQKVQTEKVGMCNILNKLNKKQIVCVAHNMGAQHKVRLGRGPRALEALATVGALWWFLMHFWYLFLWYK